MKTIWRVFAYLKRYPWLAAGTLACAIAGTLMVIVFPAVTKSIVDEVVYQRREDRLMPLVLFAALRDANPWVTYRGDFYGQSRHGEPYHDAIGAGSLISLLRTVPAGYTELGCHPALTNDLETTYAAERLVELATLCDPEVRRAVEANDIELRSFHDVVRRG